jgi:hypothetical protein
LKMYGVLVGEREAGEPSLCSLNHKMDKILGFFVILILTTIISLKGEDICFRK